LSVSPLPFEVMSPLCPTDVDVDVIVGEWLRSDDDVEYCCGKLFRSEVFLKDGEKVRYELISIANEVCSVFSCIPSEYLCVHEVDSRVWLTGRTGAIMRDCISCIGCCYWTETLNWKHSAKSGK
jgi:hypothetical protein